MAVANQPGSAEARVAPAGTLLWLGENADAAKHTERSAVARDRARHAPYVLIREHVRVAEHSYNRWKGWVCVGGQLLPTGTASFLCALR
ncbi:MAG: hypothetical protein ACLPZR_19135 [Solirubrobacteraceae bacterium]